MHRDPGHLLLCAGRRRRAASAQDGRRRLGRIIAPVFLHIARVLPDHARVQSALPQGLLLGLVVKGALTKLLARIRVRVLVGDAAPDPASAEASLSNAVAAKLVEDFGLPLLEAETVLRHPPPPASCPPAPAELAPAARAVRDLLQLCRLRRSPPTRHRGGGGGG